MIDLGATFPKQRYMDIPHMGITGRLTNSGGNNIVSKRRPRSAAAIRASSKKAPKPIVICRSKGSVSGKRLSRSHVMTA